MARKSEADVDAAIEEASEAVSEHGDNTDFTQAQSVEIYQSVAQFCTSRANQITAEMDPDLEED